MSDYLPKDATIEQACKWLEARTGETWILARLLECHLTPYFWLDYTPEWPATFGDRIEGYQTKMLFQGDMTRLESDGVDALVNMFAAHDGELTTSTPAMRVPLSDLRFKRECIKEIAEIINASKQAPPQAAPEAAPVVPVSGSELTPVTTGDIAHVPTTWTLRKPKRFQGYTEPLYLLLGKAHSEGKPRPRAREVLQAWAANLPAQIAKVIEGESLDYYLEKGGTKTANLRAIAAAITEMTGKSQN